MREHDEFIGQVEDYLIEFDGATPLPGGVIDAIHAELPRTRQAKASPGLMTMPAMRSTISSRARWGIATLARLGLTAVVVVATCVVGLTILRQPGVGPGASPSPTAALGTAEPAAGPIDCGNQDLETGTVLGCSEDGTRLIQKGLPGNLFVLRADGSETQVSEPLSGSSDVVGSSRPSGATISPDGSRVVFAGKTVRGRSCHDGALFAVDANGGPADVLWKSQAADDGGIVRDPMFSPDGTQIAFADGYCNSSHSVWVMNADGSDAHRISDTFGAGHVHGLAWSPAGDRIAIAVEGEIYAGATDGSGFTQSGDASGFCWPGRRCPAAAGPETLPSPTAALGTAEPVASPSACRNRDLPGALLGCSRDGSRLLIQQGLDGKQFVVHADGSETRVSEQLSGSDVLGSARPSGATISPDGSRVVFAGKTRRGHSCHDGALFAVDADGGPAEVVWTSQAADNGGIVRYPTFSPDGMQIAFADGYCDWNHSVWLMNADGSDAHQILDIGPTMGAGWVRGLAWSPAGDRIALRYQGVDFGFDGLHTYTFATDGSGFTQGGDASEFCWPGRRC